MPNYNGLWSLNEVARATDDDDWPRFPGAPTAVSATATNAQASVSFTAPTFTGVPAGITQYRVTSSPGGITATGSSSPIVVTGLTNGTAYTFTVAASNTLGYGSESSASNSVTPSLPQQVEYTTAGTYSWVAPSGLSPSAVSVVCVGGGGSYGSFQNGGCGGGGGGLGYKNNISVVAATSYTVVVGARSSTEPGQGGDSYFISTGTVKGGGGYSGIMSGSNGTGGAGGNYTGDGGGNGGAGGPGSSGGSLGPRAYGGGGGAGGYSGNGGGGGYLGNATGSYVNYNGTNGSGGGGASGYNGAAGGGVGLLGQGSNGVWAVNSEGGSGGNNNNDGIGNNTGKVGGGRGSNTAGGWTSGGVRIIWTTNGTSRAFPSTNTGDL